MSSSSLIRLGGAAAVLGSVLIVVSSLVNFLLVDFENFAEEVTTGAYTFTSLLALLAAVFLLAGLVGLYAGQAETSGGLGFLGFVVAFLGTALMVGAFWESAFAEPAIAEVAPEVFRLEQAPAWLDLGFTVTFALVSLGWLLFGIATLRARVYPRIAAILLIVGAVASLVPVRLTELILAVAIGWLGVALFSGRAGTDQRSPRVA